MADAALTASETRVEKGRSVQLRWLTSEAIRVELDQGIGVVSAAGSLRVTPEASTTYTLTAHGPLPADTATAVVTVTVTARARQTLLPPNATPLERGMEASVDRPADVPINTLWSSAQCPVDQLPYLAWALGVEDWDADWPETVKRAVIAQAFQIHREKGTLAALKRLLTTAGADYKYIERPKGVAMTAELNIYNSNSVYLPAIADAVDRVKRASLHLKIQLYSSLDGTIAVAGGLGAAQVVEMEGLTGFTA